MSRDAICGRDIRVRLRLTEARGPLEFHPANLMTTRRFEETINGQGYEIEVLAVRPDRWRADLVRMSDGPAALMPFYGRTPDEAARQLANWLARAHRVAKD